MSNIPIHPFTDHLFNMVGLILNDPDQDLLKKSNTIKDLFGSAGDPFFDIEELERQKQKVLEESHETVKQFDKFSEEFSKDLTKLTKK